MMVAVAATPSVTFLTACFLFATANVTYGFSPIIPVWKQRQSSIAIPSSTRFSKQYSDDDVDVQVYDNVFSPVACKVIHCLAVEHSFWVNSETSIFVRPPWNTRPLTPLEHVMDSALTAMNDTSKLVEYWSREEYMNIDAHVDIDEERLEEEGCLAVPLASHVLYLEVNATIRGPTCVFPSKRTCWDFETDETDNKPTVDLVVVPAVQGRILRFPGSAMHAVPCPPDRWLMTDEEERQLREEQCDDDEEEFFDDFDEGGQEEDDDDEDDEEEDIERSVLLFNTWPDDGPAPLGAKNVGCSDSLGGAKDEEQLVREWEEDYGVNAELIRCNPTSDWHEKLLTEGATTPEEEEESSQIRVNLMGDQNRRVFPDSAARLCGPVQELRGALGQENEATWFRLV